MANLVQYYLDEQSSVLMRILKTADSKMQAFVEASKDMDIRRIFLIGSGSSYYAAYMAKPFLEHILKTEVTPIAPSLLKDLDIIQGKDVLNIIISQSGKSTNTYGLLCRMAEKGYTTVGLTSSEDSEIARACRLHIEMDCGKEETGPKTKGVTSSILMLYLMGLKLADAKGLIVKTDYDGYLNIIQAAISNIPENIRRSRDWYELNKAALSKERFYTVVGSGIGYYIAMEGALKLLETLFRPACAYEFEEFIHGVHRLMGPDYQMICLIPGREEKQRMLTLYQYACRHDVKVYMVTNDTSVEDSSTTLKLASTGDMFTEPFEFIIPMQVLSAYLSEYIGNAIDEAKFPDFSMVMQNKIQ